MSNDEKIIDAMIKYIENKEKELLAMKTEKPAKSKAVSDIMKELERQMENED